MKKIGLMLMGLLALTLSLTVPAKAALQEFRDTGGVVRCSIDDSYVIQSCTIAGGSVTGAVGSATALAANGANCSAGQYPLGVDASGAVESCTADDDSPDSDAEVPDALTIAGGTIGTSDITLKGSASPTPTAEGRIEWDSTNDRIVIGDGVGQKTFYSGEISDTNAGTICSGATTYLNGEGSCVDISSVYQAADTDLDDLADGSLSGSKVGSGIDAGNITAGSLGDARLSANVPLIDAANSFSGYNSFKGMQFRGALTAANICADACAVHNGTTASCVWVIADQFALAVSSGSGAGMQINDRTGTSVCL